MMKKIGDFLFIILALCAMLILLATGSRKPPEPQTPSTSPTEQTDPQPTADGQEQTPTVPPQTTPVRLPDPDQTAQTSVDLALEGRDLEQREITHQVWVKDLNDWDDTRGTARDSLGWALVQAAHDRKADPIAVFLALEKEGLFNQDEDCGCTGNSFPVPRKQTAKTYAATEEGARQLLTDLLNLASELEDGLDLETALLGSDGSVTLDQVRWDRSGGLWYACFAAGGERSTHVLCFRLRPDRAGKSITDVEFQLLNLRSAEGSGYALDYLDRRGNTQSATLMSAAELLLTGRSKAHSGSTSDRHWLSGYSSTMERDSFTGDGEAANLTTYRLRKG